MGNLVLRPHSRIYQTGEGQACFEMPLFAGRLSADGDAGLYMAVREYGRDSVLLYLHMPLEYVARFMTGWCEDGVPTVPEILAFAIQNQNNLAHFVIGVEREDLGPEEIVVRQGNLDLNVLRLRMPED